MTGLTTRGPQGLGAALSRRAVLRYSVTAAAGTLLTRGSRHEAARGATVGPPLPPAKTVARQVEGLLAADVARRAFRGAVLIARRDQVLVSKGVDWADVARRVPNTPRTRFRIASVTKQFTAMAILQLQDRGALHVHDPLAVYLSPCPAAWRSISLHQLLTHTSGIPDYTTLPSYPATMTRRMSPAQLIALFRDRPLDFSPGTQWRYSNSGYVLLGYLIERLSGMSFARFLDQHIFRPLHLQDTGVGTDPPVSGPYATGYASWKQTAVYDRSAFACGDLYSTVSDLYRWDQAITTGHPALVSAPSLRAMFTPYVATDPAAGSQSPAYGYGWFIGRMGRYREIEHTGDISGFLSANQLYPNAQLTVIVLSNLESSEGLRALTTALAGIALGYADCATLQLPCTEL